MTPFYLLAVLLGALLVAMVVAGIRSASSERRPRRLDPAGRQRDLLAQLADLEFEYLTGKIGEEEYRELKLPLAKAALAARPRGAGDDAAGATEPVPGHSTEEPGP